MPSKKRIFLDRASTAAFGFGQKAFLKGTIADAERRGEKLAMVLHRLDRKHRDRTKANLRLAYPEWSSEHIDSTSLEVYRHFGRVTADFMRTELRTSQEVNSAEVVGMEHLKRAHALGKGVLIITAHYGNWERFAHWFTINGFTLNVVARDANQGAVTEKMTAMRNLAGAEVLARGNAARAILGKLKSGDLVGILNDQNNGDCFVPFFGKPCGTALGPAVLHLRTGAPLVPSYFTRLGPGKYRAEFHEPVWGEDFDRDEIRVTSRLNEILEAQIRKHPEQWLWLHDRWKSARQRGLL
jgi:Kdo2-lipid IVA lauroyltransferase/acyltransferase